MGVVYLPHNLYYLVNIKHKGVFLLKNHQKKSKWIWIVIILFLVLLIAASVVVATVAHYRKGMETAFSYSDQYTEEELEEMHKDLNHSVHDTIQTLLPEANIDILNDRDRRKLSGGDLTPEQTAEIFREARKRAGLPEQEPIDGSLLENVASPSPSPVSSGAPTVSSTPPVPPRSVDTIIQSFYVLKSKYVTSLDKLIRQCKVEWRAKPKSEQTFSARLVMAEKCMRLGNVLESECDAEMASLMAELKAALTQGGQSTSIISEIQAIYDQEKQLKKAALISRYYPS